MIVPRGPGRRGSAPLTRSRAKQKGAALGPSCQPTHLPPPASRSLDPTLNVTRTLCGSISSTEAVLLRGSTICIEQQAKGGEERECVWTMWDVDDPWEKRGRAPSMPMHRRSVYRRAARGRERGGGIEIAGNCYYSKKHRSHFKTGPTAKQRNSTAFWGYFPPFFARFFRGCVGVC